MKELLAMAAGKFGILTVIMLADLVTGLIKAQKVKEKISSGKLRATVTKSISYFVVLLIASCLGIYAEPIFLTVFFSFLLITESVSVLENLSKAFNLHIFNKLAEWLNGKANKKLND